MNKIISYTLLIVAMAALPVSLWGQTEADDAIDGKELKEVVVEAQMSMPIEDGQAYIPKSRLKKASMNTFQLLAAMHIPMLKVDIMNGSVTTNTEQKVEYFLNGLEASDAEIANLRPKDIQRIEVLHNPVNPVYHGKEYVLNIIAKEYEYGGYTTLNGSQKVIANDGDYSVYSKFVKGRSTWQLTGSGGYDNTKGFLSDAHNIYRMKGADGNEWTLDRYKHSEMTKRRFGKYNGGIQWRYNNSTNFNAQITAGVDGHKQPHNDWSGTQTDLIKGVQTDLRTSIDAKTANVTPSLGFMLNYLASEKLYFSLSGNASHSDYDKDDIRREMSETASSLFENIIREKVFAPSGKLSAYYVFPNRTQLALHLSDDASIFDTRYRGTANAKQHFVANTTSARAMYTFKLPKQWNLSLDLAYVHSLTRQTGVDDINENMWNGRLSLSGSIAQKHSLSFTGAYQPVSPGPSMYTSVVTQNSSYTGTIGNPDLKWQKYYMFNLNYFWFASNRLTMAFSARYSGTIDATVNGFLPYNDVMYRIPVTSGNNDEIYMFLTGDYNISSALSLSLSVTARRFHQTGIFKQNRWLVQPTAGINYTPNSHIMMSAKFGAPDGRASVPSGSYEKRPQCSLWLSASYTTNNWGVRLDAMPLNRYFKTETETNHPYADIILKSYDPSFGRYVALSFNYSFEYGKKVDRSQSINISGNSSSTIR